MSGTGFDKDFLNDMVNDHQKDIASLQADMSKFQNENIKQTVQKALPILENHMRDAEHAAAQVGVPAQPGFNQPAHPSTSGAERSQGK